MPASAIRRHGPELLAAVKKGLKVPAEKLPVVSRPPRPQTDHAYDRRLARLKVLRNRRAADHDMDSGLLCPNATLQAVARAAPTQSSHLDGVGELRRWQRGVLGEDNIFAAVSEDH